MIITVGGTKGGIGKSLIAVNLTVLRSLSKRKVLLVDADEQETSSNWAQHRVGLDHETLWTTIRLKDHSVRSEILKLIHNYDDIIIDCGGRDTASMRAALTISNMFLVPFPPKSFDIWTTNTVNELIIEAKKYNTNLQSFFFINRAHYRGTDNTEAEKIISKSSQLNSLDVTICERLSFSNATSEGRCVVEMNKDKKAINEITQLYNKVFDTKLTYKRHK